MTGTVKNDCATLSARQAALRAGVDERDLRRRIERGELVAVKDGLDLADPHHRSRGRRLTLHDEVGGWPAAPRRPSAGSRGWPPSATRCCGRTRALRGQLAAAPAKPPALPRRSRLGLRRREPEYDWRIVGGLIETEGD